MIASGATVFRGPLKKARERMRKKILFMAVILFSALFSVLIFLDIIYWVFN